MRRRAPTGRGRAVADLGRRSRCALSASGWIQAWSGVVRVLVTGHLGYIGVVVSRVLQTDGFDVVGLDTDLYRDCTFGPTSALPTVRTIARDLRDIRPEDLVGLDAVVHLAALSNDPLGNLDPELTMTINNEGSIRP